MVYLAMLVLCVIGAAAFFFLPVRELPDVDPPVVSVSTSYRGASAEVIESRITEPIEQQIAGIQGVERISSSERPPWPAQWRRRRSNKANACSRSANSFFHVPFSSDFSSND